jgi:hypothetical protein
MRRTPALFTYNKELSSYLSSPPKAANLDKQPEVPSFTTLSMLTEVKSIPFSSVAFFSRNSANENENRQH